MTGNKDLFQTSSTRNRTLIKPLGSFDSTGSQGTTESNTFTNSRLPKLSIAKHTKIISPMGLKLAKLAPINNVGSKNESARNLDKRDDQKHLLRAMARITACST